LNNDLGDLGERMKATIAGAAKIVAPKEEAQQEESDGEL
jgi:hypothetical protein